MTVLSLALATADKPDPTKWIGPGLLGFLTIALIGVATFFLWRSMNKHLKKVDFAVAKMSDSAVAKMSDSAVAKMSDGEEKEPNGSPS